MSGRRLRVLLLYSQGPQTETLSYYYGWPRAFAAHPGFEVSPVNLLDRGERWRLVAAPPRRLDAVVLLHSVFSNEPHLRGAALERVARLRAPTALFVGNEYKLMPEKMRFAGRLGVRLLVTQLDDPAAQELYRERLGCAVAFVPYTGLDAEIFAPGPGLSERPIDLGYRAFDAPLYLGNDERRLLAETFAREGPRLGLRVDVALGAESRFGEREWAAFLRRCRGQLGSEAGGDYFELDEETRLAVSAYLAERPGARMADVHERFFRNYPRPVSGRSLSGRVVEAAGTKTAQLLIEGRYGGFFRADEHYIPLRRDLSNLEEAVAIFRDDTVRERLVGAAHETAMTQLTYPRLVDRFRSALEPLL